MSAIHQLIAGFSTGDAISNEAKVFRRLFQSWGFESELFCDFAHVLPECRHECEDMDILSQRVQPSDIVLLHLSMGSRANDLFPTLACQRAILYHNITPADYFRGINETLSRHLAWGRQQAARLAGSAQVCLAVSPFNAAELQSWKYPTTGVLPIIMDLEKTYARPNPARMTQLDDGAVNVIFVGRCVPNKKIEDLLVAFAWFQKYVAPKSRLVLAGSYVGMSRYHAFLTKLARDLGVYARDLFAGSISQGELNAIYESADLFLCMSEHEGFCIPLIESMAHEVPILAYNSAAIPETLEGAGVLFHEKRWPDIAEMMACLTTPSPFRDAVIAKQNERFRRYTARPLAQELKQALAPLISGNGHGPLLQCP